MRLLTERLAWMDGQTRQLATENEWLRRELDNSTRQIEVEARERAKEIVAELEAREEAPAEDVGVTREVLARRVSELEGDARARIDEIRARSAELDAPTEARLPAPDWPAPAGEPVAGLAPPEASEDAQRARAELEAVLDYFDTGKPLAVDIGETHDVGYGTSLRIDAPPFINKADAGNAQSVDPLLLLGRDAPPHPNETRGTRQAGADHRAVQVGEHLPQVVHRLIGVNDFLRVGINRCRRETGRQQHAVAVENVGAHRWIATSQRRHRPALGSAAKDGQVQQPDCHHQECQHEDHATTEQPVTRGLKRPMGDTDEATGGRRLVRHAWLRLFYVHQ